MSQEEYEIIPVKVDMVSGQPKLSFYPPHRIYLNAAALRVLGMPEHIQFLQDRTKKHMIIRPCDGKDSFSIMIKYAKTNIGLTISNQAFEPVFRENEIRQNTSFYGEIDASRHMIIVTLSDEFRLRPRQRRKRQEQE